VNLAFSGKFVEDFSLIGIGPDVDMGEVDSDDLTAGAFRSQRAVEPLSLSPEVCKDAF
jgi:hypothetical protein